MKHLLLIILIAYSVTHARGQEFHSADYHFSAWFPGEVMNKSDRDPILGEMGIFVADNDIDGFSVILLAFQWDYSPAGRLSQKDTLALILDSTCFIHNAKPDSVRHKHVNARESSGLFGTQESDWMFYSFEGVNPKKAKSTYWLGAATVIQGTLYVIQLESREPVTTKGIKAFDRLLSSFCYTGTRMKAYSDDELLPSRQPESESVW